MAFIDKTQDGNKILTFYNVSQPVGTDCPNRAEDVKIVQFFLQRLYSKPKYQKFKPWGEMRVDGKFGPITRAWITKFQLDCRRLGVKMMVDGVVNKAGNPEGNYKSFTSQTRYMIRVLNNMMFTNDQRVYKTLTTNPKVPADLKPVFLQIQAEGPTMVYENAAL
jgi:hypothetical protein